ncbi:MULTISPECIES: hypothetical protein [Xanthomonas]|uniref:hypothetical protein n=1 Tax=Xanthomonas TaxID=338 RepID=UPI0013749E3D|nr:MULTISPECIES: hypothetical protein [Xanthomonas]
MSAVNRQHNEQDDAAEKRRGKAGLNQYDKNLEARFRHPCQDQQERPAIKHPRHAG